MLEDAIPIITVTGSIRQALNSASINTAYGFHSKINSTFPNDPPTALILIETQHMNTYWNQVCHNMSLSSTAFTYGKNSILERKAPIDGAIQKLLPTSLRTTILDFAHYFFLPDPSGEHQMYNSLRWGFYWPNRICDTYTVVYNCTECLHMGTKFNNQWKLELFPSAGSLEFVVIDIFGPLPITKASNQFILIITDKITKLKKVIEATKITSTHVSNIFFNDWLIPY